MSAREGNLQAEMGAFSPGAFPYRVDHRHNLPFPRALTRQYARGIGRRAFVTPPSAGSALVYFLSRPACRRAEETARRSSVAVPTGARPSPQPSGVPSSFDLTAFLRAGRGFLVAAGAPFIRNASGTRRSTPARPVGQGAGAGSKGARVGRHHSGLRHELPVDLQQVRLLLKRLRVPSGIQPLTRNLGPYQFDHLRHRALLSCLLNGIQHG